MRSRSPSACSPPNAPATPAHSTRSPRACCQSRSAKRQKPCRSSSTAARPMYSPSAGARNATPTMPKAALWRRAKAGPTRRRIAAALPSFTGMIEQIPPRFSAVKIEGARAYDLAREGEVVNIAPRTVTIYRLGVVEMPDRDHTVLAAECGKGTYVRALARDLGRSLSTLGTCLRASPRPRRPVCRSRHDFAGTA